MYKILLRGLYLILVKTNIPVLGKIYVPIESKDLISGNLLWMLYLWMLYTGLVLTKNNNMKIRTYLGSLKIEDYPVNF